MGVSGRRRVSLGLFVGLVGWGQEGLRRRGCCWFLLGEAIRAVSGCVSRLFRTHLLPYQVTG